MRPSQCTFAFTPNDPAVIRIAEAALATPGDSNDQAMRALGAAVILMTGCGYSAEDQAEIARIFREAVVQMAGEPDAVSTLDRHEIVKSGDLS